MYCGKCGAENAQDAKFCKKCGNLLNESSEHKNKSLSAINAKYVFDYLKNILLKVKTLSPKMLIGTVVAIVGLIVVICVAVNSGKTINLNKYIVVEEYGYDGYGSVNIDIDWDAIEEKYGSKLSFGSKAQDTYEGFLGMMTPIDALQDYIDVEEIANEKLSNGDSVKFVWNIDEEFEDCVKCKIKYEDGTYKVSCLKEIEKFDPFEGVEVSFNGIAPNGNAEIVTYPYENGLSYDLDKYSGISNGEIVTLNVNYGWISEEEYAERYGRLPSVTSKEFSVSGLEEYVSNFDEMAEEFIAELKIEAEDAIYSYVADSYDSTSSLSELTYAGYILKTAKEAVSYWMEYNNVYIIYSGIVASSDESFNTTRVYFPVRFSDVVKGKNSFKYNEKHGIVGDSYLDSWWHSTKGYTNPLTCYLDIEATNQEYYSTACGDGYEKYEEYEVINKLDDISESYKEQLYADAKTRIEKYIEEEYSDESVVGEITLAGEYLLSAKNQGIYLEENNRYYVVYSATVSHERGYFDATTVYFPVTYNGIVKLTDEEFLVTASEGVAGYSSFPGSWYTTRGYINGTEMYTKIITASRDEYTYEVSESLKSFGE